MADAKAGAMTGAKADMTADVTAAAMVDAPGDGLRVDDLTVSHGGVPAVHGLSLSLRGGEIVTLIGANGAGKTSSLGAIMGLLPAGGSVRFDGQDLTGLPAEHRVARGLALVPEQRALFAPMSIEDNLMLGAWSVRRLGRQAMHDGLEAVYGRFPRLRERRAQAAGTLSGGERQMLAIGRALMARPRVLMLDEPSLGLAPRIIDDTFRTIDDLRGTGVAILLVEQNARAALRLADRAIVLENGRVVTQGPAPDVARDDRVAAAYLGIRRESTATIVR